ncbi:MAG: hypothetical protein FWF01_01050 [Alphaproteobacteria bacterium]|nr:hypothetical protein [Alphaproteobacteria bacterium]
MDWILLAVNVVLMFAIAFISARQSRILPAVAGAAMLASVLAMQYLAPWMGRVQMTAIPLLAAGAVATVHLRGLYLRFGLWMALSMGAAFLFIRDPALAVSAGLFAALFLWMMEAEWMLPPLPGAYMFVTIIGIVGGLLIVAGRQPGLFWTAFTCLFITAGFSVLNRYSVTQGFKLAWSFVILMFLMVLTSKTTNVATAIVPVVPLLALGLLPGQVIALKNGCEPAKLFTILIRRQFMIVLLIMFSAIPSPGSQLQVQMLIVILSVLWAGWLEYKLRTMGKNEVRWRDMPRETAAAFKQMSFDFKEVWKKWQTNSLKKKD